PPDRRPLSEARHQPPLRHCRLGGHSRALAQPSAPSLLARFACFWAGGEQLPVPLGDHLDGAVGHLYGGLIVDRVRRSWYPGGPSFCDGHGVVRQILVIHVRNDRKINDSQRSVTTGGRTPEDE